MKRFLAIILCAALVIAMVPAVFATTEEIILKYNFTTTDSGATDLGAVTYDTILNGNKWQYASYYKTNTMAMHAGGTRILPTSGNSTEGNNGIAIKIDVPEGVSGKFKSTFTYAGLESGGLVNVYIVSAEDVQIKGWDMHTPQSSKDLSAIYQAMANSKAEDPVVTRIIEYANTYNAECLQANVTSDFSKTGTADGKEIELSTGTYYLIFGVAGADENAKTYSDEYNAYYYRICSMAFEKVGEIEVDKTHNFVFSSSTLSDETITTATAAGNYTEKNGVLSCLRSTGEIDSGGGFIDEYTDFDSTKESDDWAYSTLGGATVYLYPNFMNLYVAKVRYGTSSSAVSSVGAPYINTRYAFKLKVKYPGTYDITASVYDLTYGTEADVYIVKASDVDSSELLDTVSDNKRVSLGYLKSIPIDGRIGNIGDSNVKKADYICTKTLEAEEYYVILHLNSNNTNYTKSGGNDSHILSIGDITLTESDGTVGDTESPVKVDDTVSFGTNIDGVIATTTVDRGKTVELTAPETDSAGKAFKCWVKGTEKNGVWVSSKANDTYKVISHTYLTAIYDTAIPTDGQVVEYYKENGEYYTTIAAVDGKAVLPETNPSLAGCDFSGWYLSETEELTTDTVLSEDVTRAVAKFEGKTILSSSTLDMAKVNGIDSGKYNFNDLVSGTDSKATYWLRDGRIVKFGTSYDYYIWDGTNIMSSYDTSITEKPIVIIENTSIDGAYMIEYDAGGKDIAEVGILFGSSAGVEVDTCSSKATSQRNVSHGQFTAKPNGDEAYARGYIIYNDAGVYRVVYTEAVALNN